MKAVEHSAIGICLSEVAGVHLALDAERVSQVVDRAEDAPEAAEVVDVIPLLELEQVAAEVQRRAVVVDAGEDGMTLVLGERIQVEALEPRALQELPAFLAQLEIKIGIMGVVQHDGRFWMLVDVDRLLARHQRVEGQ